MKKNLRIFIFLIVIAFLVWHQTFFNFFAQDDFILVNYFSGNNLWQDLKNVFWWPSVTHWRPVHNLYFLISGNLFGKNYVLYHLLTLMVHSGAGYLIYMFVRKLLSDKLGVVAAVIYVTHPAHFVSLFWISGAATAIGFLFLLASLYSYQIGKRWQSTILYLLALLASEAMIVGLILFYCFKTLKQRVGKFWDRNLIILTIISGVFILIRILVLTSRTTFDIYKIEFSPADIWAIRYYLLRIAGFAEVSGDFWMTLSLTIWLLIITLLLWRSKRQFQWLSSALLTVIVGLFPFILIPSHLSAHYMNIAIWGFALLVALAIKNLRPLVTLVIVLIFAIVAFYNIGVTGQIHWVTQRSRLAKTYIQQLDSANLKNGSTIIFADSQLSTSQEAYYALGAGEAIKFWFGERGYETCFTAFEKCQ